MLKTIKAETIKSVRGRIRRSTNGQIFKSNVITKRHLDDESSIVVSEINDSTVELQSVSSIQPTISVTRIHKRQDPVTSRDDGVTRDNSEPTNTATTSNKSRNVDSPLTTSGIKSISKPTTESNTSTSKDQVHAP